MRTRRVRRYIRMCGVHWKCVDGVLRAHSFLSKCASINSVGVLWERIKIKSKIMIKKE